MQIRSFHSGPSPVFTRSNRSQSPLSTPNGRPKVRFGSASPMEQAEQVIGTLKNAPIEYLDSDYRYFWNSTIAALEEPGVREALAQVFRQLKPFFVMTPSPAKQHKRNRENMSNTKALAQAISQIPHEGLRAKAIGALIDNQGSDYPYNFLREAGVKAILSVTDTKERDKLIEKACGTSGYFARALAVEAIGYHSDPMVQEFLLDRMLKDNTDMVIDKAKLYTGKLSLWQRLTSGSKFGNLLYAGNKVKTPTLSKSTAPLALNTDIAQLASRLVDQVKGLTAESQPVPSVEEIKQTFYSRAKAYVTKDHGFLNRLFPNSQVETQTLKLTQVLLEAALMGNQISLAEVDNADIARIVTLFEKRTILQREAQKAQKIRTEQDAMVAQAEQDAESHRLQVAQQELVLKKPEIIANDKAYLEAAEALKQLQTVAKQSQERLALNHTNAEKTHRACDRISRNIQTYEEQMRQAVQYSMAASSQNAIESIEQTVSDALNDGDVVLALEAGKDKKHQLQSNRPSLFDEEDQVSPALVSARVEQLKAKTATVQGA